MLVTGVFVFFNTHTSVVFEKEDPQKADTDFCVHEIHVMALLRNNIPLYFGNKSENCKNTALN